MKKTVFFTLVAMAAMNACTNKNKQEMNPFFSDYQTPYQVPPFEQIKAEHYMPALVEGIRQKQEEVKAISENKETPGFDNTIVALEESGKLLRKVSYVFFNLLECNTSDSIQLIASDIAPQISKLNDDIFLNAVLFERVKAVYEKKDSLKLNIEQKMLLQKTYKAFVRGGANLLADKQQQFREINKQLSVLSLKFSERLLNETNGFKLWLEKPEDLAGLPQGMLDAAAQAAKENGKEGKWLITLHAPGWIPFLQYSSRRDLREKVFTAYINRGNHNDSSDTKAVIAKIAALRFERANMLGYKTDADYELEENMAKNPQTVYKFLNELMSKAIPVGKQEAAQLQAMIDKEGGKFKLEPWDWWYYTEKLRKQKYDLDDETLRPYFELNNVREGAFMVANKLYGLKFVPRTDLPNYNKEAQVFEVQESDGSFLGLMYMDFFPRASKRGGAWCSAFREAHVENGQKITPIETTVFNFSEPTADKPALLSFEEASTLFHEFGHALHGLFSQCNYITVANVPRDFVELPSQVMENWAAEPEVMKVYAKHYKTGEPIPQELIDKIKKTGQFNMGFITLEYLAASLLDMDWHTLTEPKEQDVMAFEAASMKRIGMIPQIVSRYRSTYFAHIWSSGYSAGYYSYIWAEILDADAFQAFKEKGIYDQATAKSFRDNVLSKGGSEDPMVLYVRFRGKEPSTEPLLRRRGLLK